MSYMLGKALASSASSRGSPGCSTSSGCSSITPRRAARSEPDRAILQTQLELMAGRLWKIITVPAMLLTLIGGITMVVQLASIPTWLPIKLPPWSPGCSAITSGAAPSGDGGRRGLDLDQQPIADVQ